MTSFRRPLLLLLVALAAAAHAQAQSAVPLPAKRQDLLAGVTAMLARKDAPLDAALPNPFFSTPFAEALGQSVEPAPADASASSPATAAVTKPAGPRGDRDLLAAIAASLKPSGYIVLGGQPSLSFGQKRVKPGGLLKITFEGAEYTLEITAIDRANFTLRLNREEFTRPIK